MRRFLASALAVVVPLLLVASAGAQKSGSGGTASGPGSQGQPPPITSGTWSFPNNHVTPALGLPLLLTDGTVLIQSPNTRTWYKLTPDITGSYVNGTWSQMASLPSGYSPLYAASAVLADGKVIIIGGEYNGSGSTVWTNLGAIYNPVANSWSSVTAPSGWSQIGDAECCVLSNGTFVLAHPFDTLMASLNESSLTWNALSGTGKNTSNGERFDEEGWTLLPDGTFLTCDCIDSPAAERYLPTLDRWIGAGSTPSILEDPSSQEMGPAVLRPNGTVFAMGANASGVTAIYTPPSTLMGTGSWVAGPIMQSTSNGVLDIADGSACLLPDGNVLCVASPGVFNTPSDYFEFDGTNMSQVTASNNAPYDSSYNVNMLMLPTGQVLVTDQISWQVDSGVTYPNCEFYTPAGTYQAAWQPTITSVPLILNLGTTGYTLQGTQLNGLSQCSAYGDDSTNATNYPIVRIKNTATGNVYYQRTHNHSTMAVATGSATVSTQFDVLSATATGPSTLFVVANGIPSAGQPVSVFPANVDPATTYSILTGTGTGGNAQSLYYADGNSLSVQRGIVFGTQTAPVQVQLNGISSVTSPASMTFTLTSNVNATGVTQNVYLYNYSTSSWALIDSRTAPTSSTTTTLTATGTLSQYVNAGTGAVSALVTYAPTSNGSANPYSYSASLDQTVWTIH